MSAKEQGREIKVEELTVQAFEPFGTFHNMIEPESTVFGKLPVQFYPDILRLDLGGRSVLGISTCLVHNRPMVVDETEFHSSTGEGILSLDADIIIHVAEPTGSNTAPWDKIRTFEVPQGVCVVLHPGVWHHAPFVDDKKHSASVLILLPVRTYANDCKVEALSPEKQTRFVE